ncbi:unnamed protein product [Arabidopsis halleri]
MQHKVSPTFPVSSRRDDISQLTIHLLENDKRREPQGIMENIITLTPKTIS